ncbi:MAG TPA: CHAT domain-containing protein [Methylomirabilota bacterium]|nr:CHAT domain-containing protein [Methylomirabilota bacterium]
MRALVITLLAFTLIALTAAWGQATPPARALRGDDMAASIDRATRAQERGAFDVAAERWLEVAGRYDREQNTGGHIHALAQLAHAYQSLGHYVKARDSLERALTLARPSSDQRQIASILRQLGSATMAMGLLERAGDALTEAQALAQAAGDPALEASVLNDLGNLLSRRKQYAEALQRYEASGGLAQRARRPSLAARALTNAAAAARQAGRLQTARARLDAADLEVRGVPDSYDKAYELVSIGLGYLDLRRSPADRDLTLRAARLFRNAIDVSNRIGAPRLGAYAWGSLGKLYEDDRRYEESLQATRQAALAAQQVNAPESLYRWQWQTGRLFARLGRQDAAISAYRRAVSTLQSIRSEITVSHGNDGASFRDSVGALYFELVDLLLQRSATAAAGDQQAYLIEARDRVESLKVAELRDYFGDDCVEAAISKVTRLDVVSPTAAVLYPIPLPDRLELLLHLPSGLMRVSVPVTNTALTEETRQFRRRLEKRTTREYLPHARQLYDWLIRPLETELGRFAIDTLIVVPDGPLRTIPMAALHDGRSFLISRFALATTPGLTLTDPRPLKRDNPRVLVAGLTQSAQGFPPLPNVGTEIEALRQLYRATALLNEEFRLGPFEKQLREEPVSIVHIASHAQFTGDVRATFLLAFDDKLTLDRLDQFIGLFRFRDEPLELLTLSACETAAGDDRAALGLAGIAVKAGARSALATLWHINDEASSALVAEFYRQLQTPATSRAAALQRAQLKLLDDPQYRHPSYWSPFLLISNWL